MVLVVLVVVAWAVILTPSFLRRRQAGDGISSITHFHHQLRVLEHSAPAPIVSPAYRLRAVDDGGRTKTLAAGPAGSAPVLTVVGAKELPRPALAFLGDDPDRRAVDRAVDRTTDRAVDRTRVEPPETHEPPWTDVSIRPDPRAADPYARQLARRRRRDTLGVLILVFVLSLLAGFIPGASVLWSVTALSGVALVAYVALLVHLRRRAEEREHKLHYLRPEAGAPVRAARSQVPTRVGGRFAHPSNGAAAIR